MIGLLGVIGGMDLMAVLGPLTVSGLGIEQMDIDHLLTMTGLTRFINGLVVPYQEQQERSLATLPFLLRLVGEVDTIETGEVTGHQRVGPRDLITGLQTEMPFDIFQDLRLLITGTLPEYDQM